MGKRDTHVTQVTHHECTGGLRSEFIKSGDTDHQEFALDAGRPLDSGLWALAPLEFGIKRPVLGFGWGGGFGYHTALHCHCRQSHCLFQSMLKQGQCQTVSAAYPPSLQGLQCTALHATVLFLQNTPVLMPDQSHKWPL